MYRIGPGTKIVETPIGAGKDLATVSTHVHQVGEIDVLEQVNWPKLAIVRAILFASDQQRELKDELGSGLVKRHCYSKRSWQVGVLPPNRPATAAQVDATGAQLVRPPIFPRLLIVSGMMFIHRTIALPIG